MTKQIEFDLGHPRISTTHIFKYPGRKSLAAPHLNRLVPNGVTQVVSPFFGSGSFELYLTGRNISILGSDNFEPLVNLWNIILTRKDELYDLVAKLPLKYDDSNINKLKREDYWKVTDDLERAALYFFLLCSSWNGVAFLGCKTYLNDKHQPYHKFLKALKEFKNPLITVDHHEYKQQLEKYPNYFAFLDPPYPDTSPFYGNNNRISNKFNHEELRDVLKTRDSQWILTYNDHPLIKDLYSGSNFEIITQTLMNRRSAIGMNEIKHLAIRPKRSKK